MAGIVIDASKIKAFEALSLLCESCGETQTLQMQLWQDFLQDKELYDEFVYFVEQRTLLGKVNVGGYTLLDLYVMEMDSYNLCHDTGKNTASCSKDALVLHAFVTMTKMRKEPEKYLKKFSSGEGMDRL